MTPVRPKISVLIFLILWVAGCATDHANRDPVGERFPAVSGDSLAGTETLLPDAIGGEPSLVLAGYAQATQFDIDRWMLGLLQMDATLRVIEVPAIEGWFPSTFLRPTIDGGMRDGIPQEDWRSVVTLYGSDAARLQTFTGTERPGNARVLLLDSNGVVAWFWDQGYSPRRLREMLAIAADPGSAGGTAE